MQDPYQAMTTSGKAEGYLEIQHCKLGAESYSTTKCERCIARKRQLIFWRLSEG